ncbi:hypothetical protein BEN30_01590 [Magnetovibrio blakemorei]|uniref:Thiamine phosphate synthase/TenI domain-containing protein n=1 Tax=Magnetovibrio blakemorei TaxID=28181 RepID=A0A1E5Q3F3_9PROT|nr:hypothetical protein BEN30_01590 [Magnetovibrio blakemorei]
MVVPRFYLLSDPIRLPDPGLLLDQLPRGACVILRHRDPSVLNTLARRIIPQAHRLGLSVLLSEHVRLALKTGADGVHVSQKSTQRQHMRITVAKPGFIVTAAAHDRRALWRAGEAGADAILLSPVFPTASHPGAQALGLLRFMALARLSPLPIIALGGVRFANARRINISAVHGFAAIESWHT